MTGTSDDDLPELEILAVQDVTAFEARVERIGPLTRIIWTIPQSAIDGPPCRAVVARLLVPTENLPAILSVLAAEPPKSKAGTDRKPTTLQ